MYKSIAGNRRKAVFTKKFFAQTDADGEQISNCQKPPQGIGETSTNHAKAGDEVKGADQIAAKFGYTGEKREFGFTCSLQKNADDKRKETTSLFE